MMRRVRRVTNAARRNIGVQNDNSGGQGIIVPSRGRIYLFWQRCSAKMPAISLFLIQNGELTVVVLLFSQKILSLGLYELFRWVYVRCERRDCVAR